MLNKFNNIQVETLFKAKESYHSKIVLRELFLNERKKVNSKLRFTRNFLYFFK